MTLDGSSCRHLVSVAGVTALLVAGASTGLCLTWTPEEMVDGDDDFDDYAASVVAAPDGSVWVAWTGTDPAQGDKEVFYSVRTGLTWSPRARVHPNNGVEDSTPVLDVGADGIPWVLWARKHEGAYDLVASHWDGAGWAPFQVVRDGGDRYDTYDMEVVSSSNVWVVTDAFVEGHDARWLLVYHWDGAAWSEPCLVGHPGTDRGPAVRVAPDGTPWLVWIAFGLTGDPVNAIACSVLEGGAWTAPAVIDGEPGNGGLGPEILFDTDGTPIVAWEGNGDQSGGRDIEYSRRDGAAWSPAELVSEPRTSWYQTNGGLESSQNDDGSLWLFWVSADGEDFHASDVKVCQWLGSGWAPEEAACDTTWGKVDGGGDVAVGQDGSVWVAWEAYVEVAPYDFFILSSRGSCTTPVDFCCLNAERSGGAVTLTWYAPDSALPDHFRVWREASPDTQQLGQYPAADAVRMEGDCAADGVSHWWSDQSAAPLGAYAYWIEWTGPEVAEYLGPVLVQPEHGWTGSGRLLGVLPNPTGDGCAISYELARAGKVEAIVYDVAGRAVCRLLAGEQEPGRHEGDLIWDGRYGSGTRAAAGVYFVRLLLDGRCADGQRGTVTLVR
jgi:hypothetical protein